MKSAVRPSIGRIVIYVPLPEDEFEATEYPAIIVKTCDNGKDELNLSVFTDVSNHLGNTHVHVAIDVPFSDENEAGTWHWPPRV